jgi:hypothetical protein
VNLTNSERRNYQRFLAPHFSISLLAIQSNLDGVTNTTNNDTAIGLTALDFNHSGMAVYSQHNFKIGDVLKILISSGINQTEEVSCFVCNRAKTDLGYRCGLHFLTQNEDDNATQKSLLKMEQALDAIVHPS